MIEISRRPSLIDEILDEGRVIRKVRMEDFQRDIAVQRDLMCKIDGSHPPIADEIFDDEITEQRAWRRYGFRNGDRAEACRALHDFTWLDIVQFEKGATMVALGTHGQRSKLDWWLKAGEAISPTFVYFTWRTGQVQLLQAFFHLPIQAQPRSARSESKRLPLK
jgi:hypothetical protein